MRRAARWTGILALAVALAVACGGPTGDPGAEPAPDTAGPGSSGPAPDGTRPGAPAPAKPADREPPEELPALSAKDRERAVDWIEALGDRDIADAVAAADRIAELGAAAYPLLVEHYRDESPRRRLHVVRLLGRTGVARAIRPLRDALKDPWLAVRVEAAEGIARLLRPDDEVTVTELLSSIKNDSEPIVTAYSARALLAAENLMGIPALVANLEKRLWPREISFQALRDHTGEDFGFDPYAPEIERRERIERWKGWYRAYAPLHEDLVEHLSVYKFLLAETAKEMLVDLGRDASAAVIAGLAHENEHVRTHCAEILGIVGEEDAAPELERALSDESPIVRMQAATSLGLIGARDAADALVESASDPDRDVRASAILALGRMHDPRAADAAHRSAESPRLEELAWMLSLFTPRSPDEHRAAAARLVELGNPYGTAWSGAQLGADSMAAVRDRLDLARTLVAEVGGDDVVRWIASAIPALVAGLTDPESTEHERFRIVELLGLLGDAAATEAVAERLGNDPSILVREGAAKALAKIGDTAAAPALETALTDGERYVRVAAVRALADCGTRASIPTLMRAREANLTDEEMVDEIGKSTRSIVARDRDD